MVHYIPLHMILQKLEYCKSNVLDLGLVDNTSNVLSSIQGNILTHKYIEKHNDNYYE